MQQAFSSQGNRPAIPCIFHADDCGMNQGVTEAILTAIRLNRLQSTSVMAGGSYAVEAMAALREHPKAFVGVHLNLLEGKASADSALVPDLVDKNGFFHLGLFSLWQKLALGDSGFRESLKEQVFTEFCAQIDMVQQHMGSASLQPEIRPSVRIDGHLHVHCLPPLRPVMEKILRRYPVSYLRIPLEGRYWPGLPPAQAVAGILRRELLAFWSAPLRKMAQSMGVPVASCFIGAYASGSMTLAVLRRGLEYAARKAAHSANGEAPALVEIMLHPGYGDTALFSEKTGWYSGSHYVHAHARSERDAELQMLLSPDFAGLLQEFAFTPVTQG